jgi:hypothetical protein
MDSKDKNHLEKEGRKVEAFLDGLAKQIKAFEDSTGHKLALNVSACIKGETEMYTPFAYCRDANATCPGCGEIHNGGPEIQATFLNTLDISPSLSAIEGDKEAWKKAVVQFVRNYDPRYPAGGPKAFLVEDGGTRFGPDHTSGVQPASESPDLTSFLARLISQVPGVQVLNADKLMGGMPDYLPGEVTNEELPEELQTLVDAMQKSGAQVKVVRLDPDEDGPTEGEEKPGGLLH